ncbi:trigger factor [Mycoplasma sp. 744]|uniref:trigger factor n=1 Tax=Mycoplasma sp. 744 TaxID=3108531 RepID=UPI002B1D85B3|nr:trigger factor [Mycoplasma sp. 744]MEA4115298.1 trigger factor [Mycoplasma sp. 744]
MSAKKNITVNLKNAEITRKIQLEGEIWTSLVENTKKEMASKIKINGYRPGKAPKHIIDKHINLFEVYKKTLDKYILKNHQSLFEEVKKENDRAVNVPSINIVKLTEMEAELDLVYPLDADLNSIVLDDLKSKYSEEKLTSKEIDKYIQEKLNANSLLVPLKEKEKTQIGDTVVINYKGFVNDEAFDGGEAENYQLKLGTKTFIDTFEEQLTNKLVGWKGEVKVTFPNEYPVSKLAGQLATFEVEIKEAKRPEAINLTDENINLLNLGERVKNISDAKKVLNAYLTKQNLLLSLDKFIDNIFEELINKNDLAIHKNVVNFEVNQRKNEIKQLLKQQNVKFNEYLELLGQTEEQLEELLAKEEIVKIKRSLIISHVVKLVKDNVVINEEDFDNLIKYHSLASGLTLDSVKSFIDENAQNKDRLKLQIEDIKVKELILAKFDNQGFEIFSKAKNNAIKLINELF